MPSYFVFGESTNMICNELIENIPYQYQAFYEHKAFLEPWKTTKDDSREDRPTTGKVDAKAARQSMNITTTVYIMR